MPALNALGKLYVTVLTAPSLALVVMLVAQLTVVLLAPVPYWISKDVSSVELSRQLRESIPPPNFLADTLAGARGLPDALVVTFTWPVTLELVALMVTVWLAVAPAVNNPPAVIVPLVAAHVNEGWLNIASLNWS